MKCSVILFGILFHASRWSLAQDLRDVTFHISPETGFSSDYVTICRVTATNYSGSSLEGRRVGFEALAFENGTVIERERGRFGGVLRNGETAETLIGFNGVFRTFEVLPAAVSSRAGRGGASRGPKGSSGSRGKKSPGGRKKKKAN